MTLKNRAYLFLFLFPLLSGFQCEPYSFTEKIHVYFNDDHSFRVLATLETNGYQPVWSDAAIKYIDNYQSMQDSMLRSNFAVNVKKLKGKWNDKITIYAVEATFKHDYDLMFYMNHDTNWWHVIYGYNDSTLKLTFNLTKYRSEISKYAYCYQIVSKEIIKSNRITFTPAGIDSFFVTQIAKHFSDDMDLQGIAKSVTWGILSESEKIVLPFSETIFSLQKYRFHVSNKAFKLTSPYLRQDIDASLVYFPYPEISERVLSYAVYSPFRPTFKLKDIQTEVEQEIPEFVSFYWNYNLKRSKNGDDDHISIIPLEEVKN